MLEVEPIPFELSVCNFKVSVQCITFNHSAYITETMDGFCRQELDEPFVCVIIDDASKDDEQSVIDNYLRLHFDNDDAKTCNTEKYHFYFARHKINQSCYFAVYLLKENHYSNGRSKDPYFIPWVEHSRYLAFCEGDDCWIDPKKIQKQSLFLDEHKDYSLVYTNICSNKDGKISSHISKSVSRDYESVLLRTGVGTLTVMMRSEIFFNYLDVVRPDEQDWFVIGDAPRWKYAAYCGKVMLMEDVTAVYRDHNGSISHQGDFEYKKKIITTAYKIKCYFNERFTNPSERARLQHLIDMSYFEAYLDECVYFGSYSKAKAFLRGKHNILSIRDYRHLLKFYYSQIMSKLYHKIVG